MMAALMRRLVPFVLAAGIPFAVVAQTIPLSEQPGRERERFQEQPAPKAKPAGPTIVLPSTVAPEGAAAMRLLLKGVEIGGATVYSPEQLAPLYADLIGHEVALASIYEIAQRITTKYGQDGYVLSRAVVPPQELEPSGAIVQIQVIEGYIDRVEWPDSLTRYRDFFSSYAAKITGERPVNVRTIERYLLLASDLPGLEFQSTLRPSETEPGASTLVVTMTERHIDLFGRADNRGTEARGPEEFLSSVRLNNILGLHESLTATYAGAFDIDELQYAALAYDQVLNSEGLTAFADASFSWGNPGTDTLRALEFHSESLFAEGGLSYPVIRSRERNLSLSGLFFLSNDEGDILAATSSLDRLRGIRLKAYFDDAAEAGNITQIDATFSQGIDGLGSTSNDNPNASREAGRVDFTKIEGGIRETLPLRPAAFSALLAGRGPICLHAASGFGGVRLRRPRSRPRLRSLRADRRPLLGSARRASPHHAAA